MICEVFHSTHRFQVQYMVTIVLDLLPTVDLVIKQYFSCFC